MTLSGCVIIFAAVSFLMVIIHVKNALYIDLTSDVPAKFGLKGYQMCNISLVCSDFQTFWQFVQMFSSWEINSY